VEYVGHAEVIAFTGYGKEGEKGGYTGYSTPQPDRRQWRRGEQMEQLLPRNTKGHLCNSRRSEEIFMEKGRG